MALSKKAAESGVTAADERAPDGGQAVVGEERIGDQHLAGVDAGEIGGKPGAIARRDAELAGGDVDPGKREGIGLRLAAALAGDGRQIIVARGGKQRLLGQRAGGDQADDVAAHHRLGAALLGLGRVLDLLADGDAMAERDQLLQILVGGMDGHAAHGDVGAEMLAALGQRDAERARSDLGIGEEHLVEIAHAVEEQAIGIGRLDLQVLRHHRRGGRRDRRPARQLRGRRGGNPWGGS